MTAEYEDDMEHMLPPPVFDVEFGEHVKDISYEQTNEAHRMLHLDHTALPKWFSKPLHRELGPIPPTDIVVVAARPGCGKTSFMLAQARSMVADGHKVIYVGTEMPGWRLRTQIAAQECRLEVKKVIQNRWSELPEGSRDRVLRKLDAFERETEGRWLFAPEDFVDQALLMSYVKFAAEGKATLFVDHLNDVKWSGGPSTSRDAGLTTAMTVGVHALKDMAKAHDVRLILAAQIRRGGGFDVLADYMVPDQGAIKQSGSVEEVAHTVLLMHRALKKEATEVDLALVRRGQKPVTDVIERGTSVLHVGKERLGGEARDAEVRLYIQNSEVFDSPEARQMAYPSPFIT